MVGSILTQLWDLSRIGAHNINFHYETNSEKKLMAKFSDESLDHFWPSFRIFRVKKLFIKLWLCYPNSIWFWLNIPKIKKKTMIFLQEKLWIDGRKEGRTDLILHSMILTQGNNDCSSMHKLSDIAFYSILNKNWIELNSIGFKSLRLNCSDITKINIKIRNVNYCWY